jgi:hypothetical protein
MMGLNAKAYEARLTYGNLADRLNLFTRDLPRSGDKFKGSLKKSII